MNRRGFISAVFGALAATQLALKATLPMEMWRPARVIGVWPSYMSEELRRALVPKFRFREFCEVHDAMQRSTGETWTFDRPSRMRTDA